MEASGDPLRQQTLSKIAILIPAWQPDERLVELTRSLGVFPFVAMLVVDDGSGEKFKNIFDRVKATASVVVLEHERNRGQWRAVKTGLRFALDNLPNLAGVVTADADGQHAPDDIVRVAEALARGGRPLVLGSRRFGANVPLRSRFGNILTQHVFAVLSGFMLHDTQTGLRGISRDAIEEVLAVRGERYEFATAMLAHFCSRGRPPAQVPIATIYLDDNRSSHFKPVRDSIRIYLFLMRCYTALFLPAAVDFLIFVAAFAMHGGIGLAVLAGRVAAVTTLAIQRGLGFGPVRPSFGLRMLSMAVSGAGAFGGIWILNHDLHWNIFVAKMVMEPLLWLALLPLKALMPWWSAEAETL